MARKIISVTRYDTMSSDFSGSAAIHSNSIAGQQEQKEPPRQTQSQEDENRRRLLQQNHRTSTTSLPSLPLPRQSHPSEENSAFAEIIMNRALYDPPRWGWTALGGIADVLSPHEVRSRSFGKPTFASIPVIVRACLRVEWCGDFPFHH